MTRSVEIPDAAVQEAAQVYWETEGNRAVCMRAALVAARPYLMPGREEIAEALFNHANKNPLVARRWPQATKLDRADYLSQADAILAALNGES